MREHSPLQTLVSLRSEADIIPIQIASKISEYSIEPLFGKHECFLFSPGKHSNIRAHSMNLSIHWETFAIMAMASDIFEYSSTFALDFCSAVTSVSTCALETIGTSEFLSSLPSKSDPWWYWPRMCGTYDKCVHCLHRCGAWSGSFQPFTNFGTILRITFLTRFDSIRGSTRTSLKAASSSGTELFLQNLISTISWQP